MSSVIYSTPHVEQCSGLNVKCFIVSSHLCYFLWHNKIFIQQFILVWAILWVAILNRRDGKISLPCPRCVCVYIYIYISTHTYTHNFINIFMNILLRSSKILVSLRTLTAAPSPCYLSLSSVPPHPIRDDKMLLPCPNVLHTVTIPNCKRWCNTFTTYMLWFEL